MELAGRIVVHQAPPTANGFHFITLEDEFGLMDVVVRPDVYRAYRSMLRGTRHIQVKGAVQRKGEVANLPGPYFRSCQLLLGHCGIRCTVPTRAAAKSQSRIGYSRGSARDLFISPRQMVLAVRNYPE